MNPTRNDSLNRTKVSRLLALLLLPLLLAACGRNDGISRSDADAILSQIQEVGARLDTVEQRLVQLGQSTSPQPAQLISEVREVGADVSEARAILSEVGDQLAQATAEPVIQDDLMNDPFNAPLDVTPPSSLDSDNTELDDQ
ncbi:MAG: hypothetical protein KF813_02295 [Trueperaceae bacterium]|nr:hypothetical protein [Trueperaceae bacterium]